MTIEETTAPEAAPAEAEQQTPNSETPETVTAETTDANEQADSKKVQAQAEAKTDEAKAGEGEKPDKPRPNRAKERIDQLTAKNHELRRKAEADQAEAERLRERLKLYDAAPPKESDFDTLEAFQAANTAYQVRQISKQEREADLKDIQSKAEASAREVSASQSAAFAERQTEFAANVPDYHTKVADPNLPLSKEMAAQIQASDQGPAVAYYLANNRSDAARIAGLNNPADVAREIGRIEGRLTVPAPKRVSSAPAPVGAVAQSSGSSSGFNPDKASVDDFAKALKEKGIIS